jgi:predicted dinucleotide-binding enzyme
MTHEKGAEDLTGLANETGAKPVEMREIVKDVDFLFLCVPMKAIKDLPREIFAQCSRDTVIVDCCNYYPSRDGSIPRLEEGIAESVWVKNHIGHDVVKAFNAILAKALEEAGRPKGSEDRIAIPVSGDDANARKKVAKLIEDLGFDAVEVPGGLDESWKQQPGSPAYCTNLDTKHLQIAVSKVKREDLPKARDEAFEKMRSSGKELDWKSLVKMLREVYVSKHPGAEEALGGSAPPVATT